MPSNKQQPTTKGQKTMLMKFSADDLNAGKLPTPGWYEVVVEKIEEKPSKDAQSINAWIKGKIVKNADTGSTEFAGVPTPFLWMVNSKAPFSLVPMIRALGVEPKAGQEANTDALVGKRLEMFIGNQPDQNGVMRSSVTGQYRPLRENVGNQ